MAAGRSLTVNLPKVDISDCAGAETILVPSPGRRPLLKHRSADGASDRKRLMDWAACCGFTGAGDMSV